MKKIFYTTTFLLICFFSANAQWTNVGVPHKEGSLIYDMEVPNANTVWASVWIATSAQPYTNNFIRSADNGSTWKYDSVRSAPAGYVISSLSPIDADTCYAIMVNIIAGTGGGIFKTTNGGTTWNQLGVGQIFNSTSFPDFVHFWNPQQGVAVGDGNGPGTPYFEIYTTNDAGVTWTRVPRANLPSTINTPFSITNSYCVVNNKIWFQAFDGATQKIYRSDDMGFHWQSYTIGAVQFSDFVFTDTANGVVIGEGTNRVPFVWSSKDGGATWKKVNYAGIAMGLNIAAIPGTPTVVSTNPYPGSPIGSSYSNDYGATWTTIDTGAAFSHSDLKFLSSTIGWSGELKLNTSFGGMFKWTGLLPVNWISFTATDEGKNVVLNWQTANELNNNYFSVERSSNGLSFSEIGEVKSKGNSSQIQQYSFEDQNFLNGQNYYRLKQIDLDGRFSYSKIVSIDFSDFQTIKLYPNPVKNMLRVEGLNPLKNTTLSIVDASGKLIQQLGTMSRSYTYDLQNLSNGTYYLKVEADKKITKLKFVKE